MNLMAVMPMVVAAAPVERIDAAKREDFGALRSLKTSEDPAQLAAYLRYLGRVDEPESIAIAREIYARVADVRMRANAVAAVQTKLLEPPNEAVPFFVEVLTKETLPEAEPIRLMAMRKLVEVNTEAATLAVLRYEPASEAEMLAKLDALSALKAHVPAKIAAYARQHARSPKAKIAEKATALVAAMKVRR